MPAQSSFGNEDYTEEEIQLIQQAEQRKQQFMQENHQKQMAESEAKNQKRIEARKAIEDWKVQRQNQIALKR